MTLKKLFYKSVFLLFLTFTAFSQENASINSIAPDALLETNEVPACFGGIWENDDRYLLFTENVFEKTDEDKNQNNYIWIYLKTFYGWYTDRAAEPSSISKDSVKDHNDTVFLDNQNIQIEFKSLFQTDNASAWEIILSYPRIKEKTIIPVAVIGNEIYLDFALNTTLPEFKDSQNPLVGSWSRQALSTGLKVSQPRIKDSLYSMYITQSGIYYIRYWQTDMPYSTEKAYFSDGITYSVPKHIQSAGKVYTCVTGRRTTIRNVEKTSQNLENYKIDQSGSIMVFGKPYSTKINERAGRKEILEIVEKNNSRRAPYPDPPFPPSNLDWHLEEIYKLEQTNALMREFRKRTNTGTVEK